MYDKDHLPDLAKKRRDQLVNWHRDHYAHDEWEKRRKEILNKKLP